MSHQRSFLDRHSQIRPLGHVVKRLDDRWLRLGQDQVQDDATCVAIDEQNGDDAPYAAHEQHPILDGWSKFRCSEYNFMQFAYLKLEFY